MPANHAIEALGAIENAPMIEDGAGIQSLVKSLWQGMAPPHTDRKLSIGICGAAPCAAKERAQKDLFRGLFQQRRSQPIHTAKRSSDPPRTPCVPG